VFGAGDHGGGGTARDIEAARRLDGEPFLPRVRMSSATGFYDAALAELQSLHALDAASGLAIIWGCRSCAGSSTRSLKAATRATATSSA
jgi:hypothetical protein